MKCFFLLLTAAFASESNENKFFLPNMKKTCICVAAACIGSLYAYNQLYSTTPSTWNYDNTMRQMCQDNNTIGTQTQNK
jgi:hypothetical protein